jgi:hypothetical protein
VFDKMKQAAKEAGAAAGRAAAAATDKAGEAAAAGIEKAAVVARDPATHAKAKIVAKGAARGAAHGAGKAADAAGRGVKSALDKLNPGTLAAIVIKATSVQEQANRSLRKSKSLYRIGGIEIGAAFPPSISFQIVRAAELELEEEAEEDMAAEDAAEGAEGDAEGSDEDADSTAATVADGQ